MKLLICGCILVAKIAASVIEDYNPTHEDLSAASYFNESTSSFIKIISSADIRYRDAIYVNAAVLFIGKTNGEILRCLQTEPTECEVFYTTGSKVHALLIAGEYVFASLYSGLILRCGLYNKGSCNTFYKGVSEIISLSSDEGYLYASLFNPPSILRCDLNQPNSCQTHHLMEESYMWAFSHFGKYIYAGQHNGEIVRCSVRARNSCTKIYNMNSSIRGFASSGNSIFAVTSDGKLWNCLRKLDTSIDCLSVSLNISSPQDVAYFNGELYVVNDKGLHICKWTELNSTTCTSHIHAYNNNAWSIAVAYETYQMQNRYKNEETSCTWQSKSDCPPFLTYYGPHERSMLEVHVRNGKLYNSKGYLVDTRNAGDEGAAIFAMGPDGKILLTNLHLRGLVHTSSIFAGNPVAGVGEMIVLNGVIKNITSCSDHYRPDMNLNRQVIQSLRAQGYTDQVDLRMCSENSENIEDGQSGTNNVQ